MMKVRSETVICPDCAHLIANGEWIGQGEAPTIGNHAHIDGEPFDDSSRCDYCQFNGYGSFCKGVELEEVAPWTAEVAEQVIEQALVTLLWQGTETTVDANGEPVREMDSYGGDPCDTSVIPADVRSEIAAKVIEFVDDIARPILFETNAAIDDNGEDFEPLWSADPGQLGHDYVLSSYGHGAGFFDRYGAGAGRRMGNKLQDAARGHLGDVHFELEPGRWFTS